MARRTLTIITAALAFVLAGCAPSGGLLIDGGSPDHGQSAVCFGVEDLGQEFIFGVSLVNEGDTDLTITDVSLLQQNTVLVSEFALAESGTDGSGWGNAIANDIPSKLLDSWKSRTPATGTTISAGERAWLLIVARTAGTLDQSTGIRGVRVEYDGAPWPRSTENDNYYGFVPMNGNCVADEKVAVSD